MRPLTPAGTPRGRAVDAAIEELMRSLEIPGDDEDPWDEEPPAGRNRPNRVGVDASGEGPHHEPRRAEVLYQPPGYRRDAVGRWRYVFTGGYVPAATDVRVADVIPNISTGEVQLLHTGSVRSYQALSFLLDRPVRVYGSASMLEVPPEEWGEVGAMVLGVSAPELSPGQLLDTTAVAALCRVSQRTVSSYLARGRFLEPVARVCGNPVWSLPVVLQWQARNHRGRTSRSANAAGRSSLAKP